MELIHGKEIIEKLQLYYACYGPSWNIGFPGLFKKYFCHMFPMWLTTLLLAEHFRMFNYWRVDILCGPSDNKAEDR